MVLHPQIKKLALLNVGEHVDQYELPGADEIVHC